MKLRIIITVSVIVTATMTARSQIDSATADSLVRALLNDYDSAGYFYFKPNTIKPGELFSLYKNY